VEDPTVTKPSFDAATLGADLPCGCHWWIDGRDAKAALASAPFEDDAPEHGINFCALHDAAPRMQEVVAYFDYAYNEADNDLVDDLGDDEIIEIRVTGKSLKDARAILRVVSP
jgi:hypothetical protein